MIDIDPDEYQPTDADLFPEEEPAHRYILRSDMTLPDQLNRALLALTDEEGLYWQGGQLVQDVEGRVVPVTRGILAVMLERRCNVVRKAGKTGFVPCRPDDSLLSALLSLPAPGPLRELVAVREDPVVDSAGRQMSAGYDRESRQVVRQVAVLRGGDLRELLSDLLADYDEVARAAWLSALVGQLTRQHYPVQPGWIIDANQPRAGKTTLANILSLVLSGRDASIGQMPRDDAEIAKGLGSRVTTRNVVLFDNVTHQIASDTLESYLSSEEWTYRPLGGSGTVSIRSNAMIVFSANGATARRDIADRCMITRIERPPATPKWAHRNPGQRALELRAQVLGAALDLIEDWATRGWPEPEWKDLGRSAGWNRWARGPAWEVYGVDPLEYRGPDDGIDTETSVLGDLLAGVITLYGEEPFQTRDLLMGAMDDAREDVRRCLAVLGNTKLQNVDERNAGMVLTRYVGRWVGDVCIRRERIGPTRRQGWKVVRG